MPSPTETAAIAPTPPLRRVTSPHSALVGLREHQTAAQWAAFAALAVAALIYLLLKGRGITFYYDDWLWIQTRSSGLHAIIDSYNNHLMAGAVVIYQLLFRTAGLSHHWAFLALTALAHLACATVVFAFTRRRAGWLALPLVLPVLVLGSGWEFVLWSINIGNMIAIALSVGALLVLDGERRHVDALACALLVLGLVFSEDAALFALGLALEFTLRGLGWRRAWVWGLPLALYGLWWLGYHEPTNLRQNLTIAPSFAAEMAAGAAGGVLGLTIDWGRAVIVAGVLLLAWRWLSAGAQGRFRWMGGLSPRAAGLMLTTVVFWVLVALGRAQINTPAAPRYVYVGAVLLLLILAEVLRGVPVRGPALVLASMIALLAIPGNLHTMTGGAATMRHSGRQMTAELGALQLARNVISPALVIDQQNAPGLLAGAYLGAVKKFGSSAADTPAQLLRAPEYARVGADNLLLRGQDLQVGLSPARRRGAANPACASLPAGMAPLALPASGLTLRPHRSARAQVRARRFAARFDAPPMASVGPGQVLSLRPAHDGSLVEWHLEVSSNGPVMACPSGAPSRRLSP